MESQGAGYPRGTGHQHEGERDDLGKNPIVDPQPYSPCSLTFKAQNSVTGVG